MRSIFLYIKKSKDEIDGFIRDNFVENGDRWSNKESTIWVSYWMGFKIELEEFELNKIIDKMGVGSYCALSIDISGTIPGNVEVMHCVKLFLGSTVGLAQDDYSDDFWEFDEIISGNTKNGRQFFNYP